MSNSRSARRLTWTRRLAESYWRGVFEAGTPAARRPADLAGVVVEALSPFMSEGARVLDIGGRRSELLEVLVAAGLRATRLDLVTRCAPLPDTLAASSFFEGELSELADQTFDAAITVDLPTQLLDDEFDAFLDVVGATVGHEGYLCIAVPNNEQIDQHLAIDPLSGEMFHPHQRVRSFDPSSIERWLELGGFEVQCLHQVQLGRLGLANGADPFGTMEANPRSHIGNGDTMIVLAKNMRADRSAARPQAASLLRHMRGECRQAPPPIPPASVLWDQPKIDAFWSFVAGTPLDDLSFARHNGAALVKVVEPWLAPRGRHIDIGAGDGYFVRLLAQAGYPVAAFEPSSGRREILDAGLAESTDYLGAIDGPGTDNRFDVAFAFEVIEHIPDEGLDPFFTLVRSLLSDSGLIIISTPCREDLSISLVYSPITGAVFHRWQHVQHWSPQSLREVVETHGFVVEAVHEIDLYGIGQGRHPFFEVLLKSAGRRVLGDGSNLICIARKSQSTQDSPVGEPS